jgi:hypothetical protein
MIVGLLPAVSVVLHVTCNNGIKRGMGAAMRLGKPFVVVLATVFSTIVSVQLMAQPADFESAGQTEVTDTAAPTLAPETDAGRSDSLNSPCSNGSCDDRCSSAIGCGRCPSIYADVEALYLQRVPRIGRQPIVEDFNSQQTVISTSDLQFGFQPGLRATVGYQLNDCRTLEFTYMGLFDSTCSASVVGSPATLLKVPDPLGSAAGVNVFVDMSQATTNYSSGLHSFEFNLPFSRRSPSCCCDSCSPSDCSSCSSCDSSCRGCVPACRRTCEWFVGFRYIYLAEKLDLLAEREEYFGTETGSYKIRAHNNLYGTQMGVRMRRLGNRLGWETTAKAGIYGNDAFQQQVIIDYPNFPLRPLVSAEHGQVAFVGELDFSLIYKLNDVWSLRAGYDLFWIEGVALAPNQLDFSFDSASGSGLNSRGGMFLHGVNVGLEAHW